MYPWLVRDGGAVRGSSIAAAEKLGQTGRRSEGRKGRRRELREDMCEARHGRRSPLLAITLWRSMHDYMSRMCEMAKIFFSWRGSDPLELCD